MQIWLIMIQYQYRKVLRHNNATDIIQRQNQIIAVFSVYYFEFHSPTCNIYLFTPHKPVCWNSPFLIFCEIKTDLQFFTVLFLDAVDACPVSNFHIFGRLFKVFLACPHLLHICNPFINLSPPQLHYYGVSDIISVIFAVLLLSPMLSIYAHGRMGMYQNGTISQIINFWSWK